MILSIYLLVPLFRRRRRRRRRLSFSSISFLNCRIKTKASNVSMNSNTAVQLREVNAYFLLFPNSTIYLLVLRDILLVCTHCVRRIMFSFSRIALSLVRCLFTVAVTTITTATADFVHYIHTICVFSAVFECVG